MFSRSKRLERNASFALSVPEKKSSQTPRFAGRCFYMCLKEKKEYEVISTAIDLFRKDSLSGSVTLRRGNESLHQHRQRVRSACKAYIYQAVLNDNRRRYGMSSTQEPTLANPTSFSEFWDAILTNQISEIDRANIARYEDAVVNAQRQRTAAITPKVIKLGVCIAQARRRSRQ